MEKTLLIKNARIVNEGETFTGSVLIRGKHIARILRDAQPGELPFADTEINAAGLHLLPGVIDDQVHFREPGLTHKADLYTESRAAVAGGITSFMEMPNTQPQTTTLELLEAKYELAAQKSLANYSFYLGATNDNLDQVVKTPAETVCGIKVFMGSSTGNMLVDNPLTLTGIFEQATLPVAVHCEDEPTVQENLATLRSLYGDDIPVEAHPQIRSAEACFRSSELAVSLAHRYRTRLHVLHLSTARELELFDSGDLLSKTITAEVCVHHLWFDDSAYRTHGSLIRWNPAIKSAHDRQALLAGLLNGKLDVVATDHAPHTLSEKQRPYLQCPSGAPMVQHSLSAMLTLSRQGFLSLEQVVEKMCHAPALLFSVAARGFIREGYYADLVLVDLAAQQEVERSKLFYKCGWSPLEGTRLDGVITHTFVNGQLAYRQGVVDDSVRGMRLLFTR